MVLDARVCDRARLARDARFDGRFFIAVLSTGIYCRPICPSPTARRENVRYFRSAEQAVAAGFRPCLRCRPEAAPGTPAWKGTSSTVSRALRLIEEGALQEQSLAELSRRLGVSARHLHRLFSIHLGTSPIAVAKTWRLNFAKQLISDTDLPMSRVALAAGFRTVRRFNDAIRSLYGRPPSELRRQRSAALHAAPDEYVFRLPYRRPYDWDSLVAFLAARAIPGVEEVVSGAYRRTFTHNGRHGVLELRHDERVHALEARVRFSEPVSLLPIVNRLRGMFDLAADTAVIARHFRGDPHLEPLVRKYPGLRVPGAWDPFEMSVRAVLGEQGPDGAGPSMAAELARRFGERLSVSDAGELTLVFPSAEILAKVRLEGLMPDLVAAIRSLARAAVSGLLTPAAQPDEESLARLARSAAIGESTAQYIALRAFRQPDAFPAGDTVLFRAAAPGDPRRAATLTALAERWRPWRAYAAVYLWRAAADRSSPSREGTERRRRPFDSPAFARQAMAAGQQV